MDKLAFENAERQTLWLDAFKSHAWWYACGYLDNVQPTNLALSAEAFSELYREHAKGEFNGKGRHSIQNAFFFYLNGREF